MKKNKKAQKLVVSVLILGLLAVGKVYGIDLLELGQSSTANQDREKVVLIRTIDGDTANFKTDTYGNVNIRFSGVNTPEVHHPTKGKEPYGDEAAAFTAEKLETAKIIEVEWDKTQEASHNRPIGIIFVDGINLNLEIVKEGYGDLQYLKPTMPYYEAYKQALEEAKAEHKNRWQ